MILILAEHHTPRLQYVLSELLERRMGLRYRVTGTAEEFVTAPGTLRINYTNELRENCLNIKPSGILAQQNIQPVTPPVATHPQWHTLLWPAAGNEIPFDVFSAAFYLLSRYEEYLIPQRDEHGRFEAKNSVAFRHNFLQVPVVDIWVEELKTIFKSHEPSLTFCMDTFTCLSTVDVDFAFLYKGIGIKRWTGKLLRALFSANIRQAITQLNVTLGFARDPYDTFDFMREHTAGDLAYFILMSRAGKHDKAANGRVLGTLIRYLKQHAAFIGIHPSYASDLHTHRLPAEITQLNRMLGYEVIHSRQHFLKLEIRNTYLALAKSGIQHDYTMMYAEQTGFRAGTCKPFFYYDLQSETATELTLHSTCAMDVTLENYLGLTPEQAKTTLQQLQQTVRTYNGCFITLWHNNSIASTPERSGWRTLYSQIFNAKPNTTI